MLGCIYTSTEPDENLEILAMSRGSESEDPTPLKRKTYNIQCKLEVVAYAEKHNKSKAAKDKKVSRSCVKDWTEQKAKAEAQLKASSSYVFHLFKQATSRCRTSKMTRTATTAMCHSIFTE